MLVIRHEQLDALKAARRAQFCLDVLERARATAPRACAAVPEETLAACIAAAIGRAERYDIFGDAMVARFAVISAILDLATPDEAIARAVAAALNDGALAASERLERAEALLRPVMR